MKIAFINQWGRGGGTIWDLRIAEELAEHGDEITFFIGDEGENEQTCLLDKFDVTELSIIDLADISKAAPRGVGGLLSDLNNTLFVRAVAEQIDPAKFDIIMVNSKIETSRYVSEWETPTVIKLNGPPYSFWRDFTNPFSSSYSKLRYFDAVVATGVTIQQIREQINIDVIRIDPGVDIDLFSPNWELDRCEKPIESLYVGRFAPSKNLPMLVNSFSTLAKQHSDVSLRLIGDGPLRDDIESLVQDRQIEDKVQFEGYIKQEDLPKYYRGARALILTSNHESFGMTPIEAMSCGTPVISTRVGHMPNLINQGENGFLVDIGDQKGLVDVMNRIISDPGLTRNLAANARKTVEDGYQWEQRAQKLRSLFKELANEKKP